MFARHYLKKAFLICSAIAVSMFLVNANLAVAAYLVDPVAYWKMEENDGPFVDSIDYEGDGSYDAYCTDSGQSYCPDRSIGGGPVANSQDFDTAATTGVRVDALGLDPAASVFDWGASSSFSIELWAKRAAGIADTEVIISRADGSMQWYVGMSSGGFARFRLKDTDGNGPATLSGTTNIADGNWHHIVAVRDDSINKNLLYVDGRLEASSAEHDYAAGFESITAGLRIGYLSLNPYYHFTGSIDEIALYNDALEETEIHQNFINSSANKWLDQDINATIVSDPIEYSAVGFTYTYDVDAAGNPEPAYDLADAQSGMTIDEDTGVVEWYTNDLQVGKDIEIEVTAENSGGDDSQLVDITVFDICHDGKMIAYWQMEEDDGPYVDNIDYEGDGSYEAYCTDSGQSYCPDRSIAGGPVGNAQDFDAASSTGVRVDALGLDPAASVFDWGASSSFSIELWAKRAAGIADTEVIISRADGSMQWYVGMSSGGFARFRLKDTDGNGPATLSGTTNIADGNWHHIVAVRDDSINKNLLYVDGKLEASSAEHDYAAGFESITAGLRIGYLSLNPYYHFTGSIDEVVLYGFALPLGIVYQHYAEDTSGRGYCNETPTITSPAAGTTATEGFEYTYDATASDPEGDTLTWSLQNAPTGMTVNPATGNATTVSWTPGRVTTSGVVTLVVDDGHGGTDVEMFTISVTLINHAPQITSQPAPTTAIQGQEYTHTATATDDDGDDLTWSLDNAPAGMTLSSETGNSTTISWTPAMGVTTSGTVTLKVEDTSDGEDTEDFNITVSPSDDDVDDDNDGYTENEGDCDDTDPDVNPGADEIPDDGIDNDCDGETDEGDDDGDGGGGGGGDGGFCFIKTLI